MKTSLLCHKTVFCSLSFFRSLRALPHARLMLYSKWPFCTSALNVEDEFAPLAARVSGQRILFRAAQTGFVSCHTWPTYPSLFIFACTSVHFWHYRPRFSLRNITLNTHCLLITDITGRIQAMCETVWKVLFLLYIILSSQS